MAIGFARFSFVKRSEGKTSCHKSAYNSRSRIFFDGNGFQPSRVYDFSSRGQPAYHEILLPDHADNKHSHLEFLWNSVEKAEKRKDAQVAFEMVLALPDDDVVSLEDKIHLVKTFIKSNFVKQGFGAQIDIHYPGENNKFSADTLEKEDDQHNWHVHVLATPRRFNEKGDGFDKSKPRDVMPIVRNGIVVSGTNWGKLWTQHQNDFFEEKGIDLRVDPTGVVAQVHLGPRRLRGERMYPEIALNDQKIEEGKELAKNPLQILQKLTETKSVFTSEDLEQFIQKYISSQEAEKIRDEFWKNSQIVQLLDKQSHTFLQKFSTLEVLDEERKVIRLSSKIHQRPQSAPLKAEEFERLTSKLTAEQKKAFREIASGPSLACIEGHAGTGKSFLLTALKDHYEERGFKVRAFGPDNATVNVLKEKGFVEVVNVHRFLFQKFFSKMNGDIGKEVWFLDEAGKMGNRPLLELLKVAEKNHVQVVLSGNSAQLPSVDRGGMFKELCQRFGYQFLGDVQRQKFDHQREIAQRLARGEISSAIDKISSTGGFVWFNEKESALIATFEKWAKDRVHHPYSNSLMIAHTNHEVMQLNELVHHYRKSLNELEDQEFECENSFGKFSVSTGDILEFRKNDNSIGVSNGLTGVLASVSDQKFEVLINQNGKERKISFDPKEYTSFHLGYSTTYYRSQGRTVDRAYVVYSPHMNRELFYVGLTRHVRNATCFVARTDASCLARLKVQAVRSSYKETTLSYTTQAELDYLSSKKSEIDYLTQLDTSESVLDRIKGGGIKSWNFLRDYVSQYVEKVTDRRPDSDFYSVPYQEVGKGRVVEIKQKSLVEEGDKLVELPKQPEETIPGKAANRGTSSSKPLSNRLSSEERALIDSYFEKVGVTSALHQVVHSEAISRNCPETLTPSFAELKKAYKSRDEAALNLYQSANRENLKKSLGEKSYSILKEQAEKQLSFSHPKDNLEEKLKENLEPLLLTLFPEGPSRKDSKGFRFGAKGSLAVSCVGEKKGLFFDFESGEGGNLLKLIQNRRGSNKAESIEWARNFLDQPTIGIPSQFSLKSFNRSKSDDWVSLSPPDEFRIPSLKELSKALDERYKIALLHPYRDENGKLLFYNLRLQEKDEPNRKIVVPLSYGYWRHSSEKPGWNLKKFQTATDKAPLYNHHLLLQRPKHPVLIVEGEKAADAGEKLFSQKYVTLSWFGGAGSAKNADWRPLFGREVVIWPDNDPAGFKAAEDLVFCLKQVGIGSLRVVDRELLSRDFPEKWDIADPIPKGKSKQDLEDLLLRAENRAIPLERLLVLRESLGITPKDPLTPQHLNEVLWRVDERMRPSLAKQFGSKTWEIENAVLEEVSSILRSRDGFNKEIVKMAQGNDIHLEAVFSALLYRAKTGEIPSRGSLEVLTSSADAYRGSNKGLTLEDKADNLSLEQQKSIGKQMDGKEK
jgi:Ti-type conjugative transfer relaxase TraA